MSVDFLTSNKFKLFENCNSISLLEEACKPSKSLPSEYGWVFLINDSNDFLRYQFGEKKWTDKEISTAADIVSARNLRLNNMGINYFKFIIPEKSTVYREFLPKQLNGLIQNHLRPASLMAENSRNVHYLYDYLYDQKSHGNLYFRGDTHTNWLGSYLVYSYIYDSIIGRENGIKLSLKDLSVQIASYEGDVYNGLKESHKTEYKELLGHLIGEFGLEILPEYKINPSKSQTKPVGNNTSYFSPAMTRPQLTYENVNKTLPKAVIFRDSTSENLTELLAQNFSRSVFIWYQGQLIWDVIEAEKPDVVLHIMAERFISNYNMFYPFVDLSALQVIAEE